jgi:hypothetical protein
MDPTILVADDDFEPLPEQIHPTVQRMKER